jgi:protein-disulfide isomerase
MDWPDSTAVEQSRRGVLLAVAAGTVSLAGCITGDGGDDTDNDTDGPAADTETDAGNSTDDSGNGGESNGNGTDETNGAADDTDAGDDSGTTAETVPVRGDPDADVTLAVYEDLGCPHCRNYVQNYFPELESEYIEGGRIRYEHRDFVVTGSAAAQAANAAREVLARHGIDAFWSYTSAVFANQDRLRSETPELLGELAANLDMDADAIETAGAERAHQSVIERDMSRGQERGVTGTPSFVLDGELVDTGGAESMGDIVDIVSDELDVALDGGTTTDDSPY